jgi:hypothetical protein
MVIGKAAARGGGQIVRHKAIPRLMPATLTTPRAKPKHVLRDRIDT